MSRMPKEMKYIAMPNAKQRQEAMCDKYTDMCSDIPYCDDCMLCHSNIEDFIKWEKEHV